MAKNIVAHSSHGTLTFDAETGEVINQDKNCNCKSKDHCTLIAPITRVDVKEHLEHWKKSAIDDDVDILDIGYWYNAGTKERPVSMYSKADAQWRKDILEDEMDIKARP